MIDTINGRIVDSYNKRFSKTYLVSWLVAIGLCLISVIIFIFNIVQNDVIKPVIINSNYLDSKSKVKNDSNIFLQNGTAEGYFNEKKGKLYTFKTIFTEAPILFKNNDNVVSFIDSSSVVDIIDVNSVDKNTTKIILKSGLLNIFANGNQISASDGVFVNILKDDSNSYITADDVSAENGDIIAISNSLSHLNVKKNLDVFDIKSKTFTLNLTTNQISTSSNTNFSGNIVSAESTKNIAGVFTDGFSIAQYINTNLQTQGNISGVLNTNLSGYILEGYGGNIDMVFKNNQKKNDIENSSIISDKIIIINQDNSSGLLFFGLGNVKTNFSRALGDGFSSVSDFVNYSYFPDMNNFFVHLKSNTIIDMHSNAKNGNKKIRIVCGDARYDFIKNTAIFTDSFYASGIVSNNSIYSDSLKYFLSEGYIKPLNNIELQQEVQSADINNNFFTNYGLRNGGVFNIYEKYLSKTDIFIENQKIDGKDGNNNFELQQSIAEDKTKKQSDKILQDVGSDSLQNLLASKDRRKKIRININNEDNND